jgi:hypothetical protein
MRIGCLPGVSLKMSKGTSSTTGPGRPVTLGSSTHPGAFDCDVQGVRPRGEPDPADQAARYGEATPLATWAARLRCSACGVSTLISLSAAPCDDPRERRGEMVQKAGMTLGMSRKTASK